VILYSWTAPARYAVPNSIITEAPFHNLWAAPRISVVQIPPLFLPAPDFLTSRPGERRCKNSTVDFPERAIFATPIHHFRHINFRRAAKSCLAKIA
jgi:hypothetical protein